jgi:hypothetical protein
MNSASRHENRSSRVTALRHAVSRNALPSVLEFSKRGINHEENSSVIILILALGIGTPAKPHPHHQVSQGKVGNASDTDAWRHYMLPIAGAGPLPDTSRLQGDFLATVTTRSKFRAEFEKAIDDFNASQENRIEADQIAALNSFIARRDAIVESYKKELISALTPQTWTEFEKEVENH